MDYYIFYIWKLVQLELIGPFDNPQDRDKKAHELYQENRGESGYFKLSVPKGTQVEIDSFSDDYLEQEQNND